MKEDGDKNASFLPVVRMRAYRLLWGAPARRPPCGEPPLKFDAFFGFSMFESPCWT